MYTFGVFDASPQSVAGAFAESSRVSTYDMFAGARHYFSARWTCGGWRTRVDRMLPAKLRQGILRLLLTESLLSVMRWLYTGRSVALTLGYGVMVTVRLVELPADTLSLLAVYQRELDVDKRVEKLGTELDARSPIESSAGRVTRLQCVVIGHHGVHGDSLAVPNSRDCTVRASISYARCIGADKVISVVKREAFDAQLGGLAGS
jgi:hypothetical protein